MLCHSRYGKVTKPQIALYVRVHDLVEGFIREPAHGAEIRIYGCVANQDVDAAPQVFGAGNQRLHLCLAGDIAGNDGGLAALAPDRACNLFAWLGLTARNHNLCSEARHTFGYRAPDAPARPGDNGHLTVEAKRIFHWSLPF